MLQEAIVRYGLTEDDTLAALLVEAHRRVNAAVLAAARHFRDVIRDDDPGGGDGGDGAGDTNGAGAGAGGGAGGGAGSAAFTQIRDGSGAGGGGSAD